MTRDDMIKHFGDNLESERMKLGFSQTQMAEALDMSLSTYKRLLTGETAKIDFYTLYRLYQLTNTLGINLGDEQNPYMDVFYRLHQLSDSQFRMIRSMVDFELAFSEGLAPDEKESDYITVLVPTGNMADGMVYDSCYTEKVNIAPYRKRYSDLIDIGIRITSNHLHPVYHRGDIILISQRIIRDGDIGIFLDKSTGLAYVRKFYQGNPCRLEPINGYGKTFYVDGNDSSDMDRWIKFGYVVTKMRT